MGSNKYKCVDKWIDLSGLPKRKDNKIDWTQSIGHIINFKYDKYIGTIEILERTSIEEYKILVITQEDTIECVIGMDSIRTCQIGNIFFKPISKTRPDLVKYFVDSNDADILSEGSNKDVLMKCPFCGAEREYTPFYLSTRGFVCKECHYGIKYPNKFMHNILTQLKVKFINELSKKYKNFKWVENYRYDFYVETNEKCFIIEMDGGFHNGNNLVTHEEAHRIDMIKDNLANTHGIEVIRIDCDYKYIYNRFDYIKNNILHSRLCNYLDFSLVNWELANYRAMENNVQVASDLWNSGNLCVIDIAKEMGISKVTVSSYLKIAAQLNLCNYQEDEINRRMIDRILENNSKKCKPIILYKDNNLIGVFSSIGLLDNMSEQLYGTYINKRNAYNVLQGKTSHAYGYYMKYISKEEYEQYKLQPIVAVY